MNYLIYIFTLFMIYSLLTASLNLLIGHTGLLSLTHAAFAGVGAYSVAFFGEHGLGWASSAIAGMALAAMIALVFGAATLRVNDIYYVVASFAAQIILYNVMLNWASVTGGALGFAGVARPFGWGGDRSGDLQMMFLVGVLTAASFAILMRLARSPAGRLMRAIRDDETLCLVLGKRVVYTKLFAFILAAILAALGGALLAPLLRFVHPSGFGITEAVFLISMVVIGGSGNLKGSLLGAAVLVAVPELLTFSEVGAEYAPQLRELAYGLALIGFMRWKPRGLLPERVRTYGAGSDAASESESRGHAFRRPEGAGSGDLN